MSDHTEFAAAIQAVADAWNDPGNHPAYHSECQEWLQMNWSTLAAAVEKLAEYRVEVEEAT